MALFNRKKNTDAAKALPTKEGVEAKTAATVQRAPSFTDKAQYAHMLKAPRITEKAAIATDRGVYVFNIGMKTTKPMIALAIKELFKVTPRKIHVTKVPAVRVKTRQTQKDGYTNEGKKAYVYLKPGDKINLA